MTDLNFDRKTTDPLGNEYHIVTSRQWPGLCHLEIKDARPDKKVPEAIAGHFTGPDRARALLDKYLSKVWEETDKLIEQREKRAAKYPKKGEKEPDAATAAG